jgi:hypothetical protein
MLVGWGIFNVGLARSRGRLRFSGALGSASQVFQGLGRTGGSSAGGAQASAIPRFVPSTPSSGAPSPRPARAAKRVDPLDRLEKLAELRDSGVLTDAEFQAQKGKILAET